MTLAPCGMFTRMVVPAVVVALGMGLTPAALAQEPPPPDIGRSIPREDRVQTEQSLAAQSRASDLAKADVDDLEPLDPPDGAVDVPTGPSLAERPVEPRPVGPGELPRDIPDGAAFADEVAGEALTRLEGHGFTDGNRPDLDTGQLLPDPASTLSTRRATPEELHAAVERMPESADVDPAELQRLLPDGIPLITYRLCTESADKGASCSAPLPLLVPHVVDVTGDGTPDVLADVLPTVDVPGIVQAVREILDLQRELASVRDQLGRVTDILEDPEQFLKHPWAAIEKLRLEQLIGELGETLADKLSGLRSLVNVGLGMLVTRLPTSETTGGPLPAHVWANYDILHSQQFSFGFDGFRRGESLSDLTWGQFTTDVLSAPNGVFDARADLYHVNPGPSVGTTLGRTVRDGDQRVHTAVANALSAPVPGHFGVHGVLDANRRTASFDVESSEPTRADVVALTNDRTGTEDHDRFTQAVVDKVPESAHAETSRDADSGRADARFRSSAPIDRAEVHDYSYVDNAPRTILGAHATGLPSELEATVQPSGEQQSIRYNANAALARSAGLMYSDTDSATVARARVQDLPSNLDLTHTVADNRLALGTSSPVGSISAQMQRNGGGIAVPEGDHTTLVTDGDAQGFSARLGGLRDFDVVYGDRPHAVLNLEPGGQPFVAAADIEGTHLARVEVSNLPPTIDVTVDPAERTVNYRAAEVIESVRAAYTNTRNGPTVDATVEQVPDSVDLSFRLGDQPQVRMDASSGVAAIEGYFSTDHVPMMDPEGGNDVYASVRDLPKSVTLDVDVPGQKIQWNAAAPVGSIDAFARTEVAGRAWTAATRITGVPAQFDADYGDGGFRFRGLSGPIDSAHLAVTNHQGATAPQDEHLAVHYQQGSGDLDASALLTGVRHVEYSPGDSGFDTRFDSAEQTVALDADVRLDGDVRLGARGWIGPLPGNISVSSQDGVLNYEADKSFDITAQVWAGATGALEGVGVPRYEDGIAASAGVCEPGSPGCASDGQFCTDKGCLGVTGIIDLSGLPSQLAVNTDTTEFSFGGYQPRTDSLRLFVRSPKELTTVPVEALATLSGLPESMEFTVGPIKAGGGSIDAGYESDVDTLARLQVDVDSEIPDFGRSLGRLVIDRVPGSLQAQGKFGKDTELDVTSSSGIDNLSAQATTTHEGEPASALAALTDVPPQIGIKAGGFGDSDGLNLPTMEYTAPGKESTLDGKVEVEAALVQKTGEVELGADDLSLGFDDLGHDTAITFNPDTLTSTVESTPGTKSLRAGANLHVSAFDRTEFDEELFSQAGGFLTGRLHGEFAMQDSRIGDIGLEFGGIEEMKITPGAFPDFIPAPAEAGLLVPGFAGEYETVNMFTNEVDLRADADMTFVIERPGPLPDVFSETLSLRPTSEIVFHRYDQEMRELSSKFEVELGPAELGCVELFTKPSLAQKRSNEITLRGEDGPQSMTFLDPGGNVPDYVLDLLAYITTPFDGDQIDHDFSLGGCG